MTSCVVCRVPSSMPLYDILNEFQKGSHMAAVTKVKAKQTEGEAADCSDLTKCDLEEGQEWRKKAEEDAYGHVEAGEVIGIITLEDVMEELLQVRLSTCLKFFLLQIMSDC